MLEPALEWRPAEEHRRHQLLVSLERHFPLPSGLARLATTVFLHDSDSGGTRTTRVLQRSARHVPVTRLSDGGLLHPLPETSRPMRLAGCCVPAPAALPTPLGWV